MLFIVMHNDDKYLNHIYNLIQEQNAIDIVLFERDGLGSSIIGGNEFNVFSAGQMLPRYNKAVIAVIKDVSKAKHILNVIDSSMELKILNMENKGFICTLPYKEIEGLGNKLKKGEIMRISDYLKKEMIELDLKAENKEETIKELGAVICKSKLINNCEGYIKDVFEREELCSTGIGREIALPHARTDNVKGFVIAFGRSVNGVEFQALDQKPVKLVFLMGTPQSEEMKKYLHILAHLNRLLQKEDFRNKLRNAETAPEIIKVFKAVETI